MNKKSCVMCGKKIYLSPRPKLAQLKQKFCSRICFHSSRGHSQKKICEFCKKEFLVRDSWIAKGVGHFCSNECRRNGGGFALPIGPSHPNWKGVSKESHRLRGRKEYKNWRNAVLERDNYTCVLCGYVSSRKKDIRADHIKPFLLFPELRYDVNNGRALCVPCDVKHGWMIFKDGNARKYKDLIVHAPKIESRMQSITCGICKKEFKVYPKDLKVNKGKWCSKACYYESKRKQSETACTVYGKGILCHPSRVRKFCSQACYRKTRKKS